MIITWRGSDSRTTLKPGNQSQEIFLREGESILDAWLEVPGDMKKGKLAIGDVMVEYLLP